MGNKEHYHYFLESMKTLVEKANLLKLREYNVRHALATDRSFHSNGDPKLWHEYNRLRSEAEKLIEEFNINLEELKKELSLNINHLSKDTGLNVLISRGKGLIAYLRKIVSPLEPEQDKKIELFRNRIKELKCDSLLKDNLYLNLEELEQGFSLGSFLISGRIIDYCLSKLIKKEKDDLIEELKKEGKLPAREEDKGGAEKALIEEILREHSPEKKYRDRAAHNINFFPRVEDSFRELSNAIKLVEKLYFFPSTT